MAFRNLHKTFYKILLTDLHLLKNYKILRSPLLFKNQWSRLKYTQNTGVKGIRNRKAQFISSQSKNNEEEENLETDDEFNLEDREYDALASSTMNVTSSKIHSEQKVFVIQPYVKWGSKKSKVTPDSQLKEAEALIRSLPEWSVELSIKVPLESLEKKTLFGAGKLKELKNMIQKHAISCVFISKGTLSFAQKRFLQNEFGGLPIMDRYSIVIQILRLHAKSSESKLQVALAEIPYIWSQLKDANPSTSRKQGYSLSDSQREMLNKREQKIKQELTRVRNQRKLLRSKRKKENYPIVAVVGYTNAGKTSLIKALTDEQELQPRDQLFATLDVTAHSGFLPCKLHVIYMDTVGFMSDIPTGLIECFIATLEDAMLSDIILHVQDISHENHEQQAIHVENTLQSLKFSTETDNESFTIPPIINVGNKFDLIEKNTDEIIRKNFENLKLVSSKTLIGINDLMLEIETKILEVTNRHKLCIRVSNGGQEMAWLYKNAVVTNSRADPEDQQSILLDVIIHSTTLQIFKHHFIERD